MKKVIIIQLLALLFYAGYAQKRNLTIEEAVMYSKTKLAPKKLNQFTWIKGCHDYAYVNSDEALVRCKATDKEGRVVLTLTQLNKWLSEIKIDSAKKFPPINWTGINSFEFKSDKKIYRVDLTSKKITSRSLPVTPDDAGNIDQANGTQYYAFTKDDFNLYILQDDKVIKVTNDGSPQLFYGRSVHREEFGITKGTFWSPAGNRLAFYRMDQSMVTDYPIEDFAEKPARDSLIKYPFAGETSHHVTVGVYDVQSRKTLYLKTGEPADQYLTNIAWSPDEKIIYIAVVNRAQDHMWLNAYDASTGAYIKTLFEEQDSKYVEPLHPLRFLPANPQQFIWQSNRDGHNHIYLYNNDGKLIKQLTKGDWEVYNVDTFNIKGDKLFFTSTINGAINRDYCSVELKTGKVTRITSQDGVHTCIISDDCEYIIDNLSSVDIPRQINIVSTTGNITTNIFKAANPLSEYNTGRTKIFTLKSDLGEDLYCRMITPVDFDSTKKYPVMVYVYGGPHVQLVTNTWLGGADLWNHVMAEKGFIVFTLDNHGSGNRSKAFEQAIFRRLGTIEMQDQLTGINFLMSLPYVDAGRIGVDGWSYGGFMTLSLLTRKPGLLKIGVAGGPVIDWNYYEAMYTERYMDTPQENKEGYDLSNLMNYVENLKGKVLIIHGTSDVTVVWQQSLMYLKKAISKGKQIDYFVYPGHLHNVLGKDRVHLITKIIDYFSENL